MEYQTSVIITTRDRAHLVPDAIRSVEAAVGGPREIIVVDDGSVDATQEVLRAFGSSIRVLQGGGNGKANARNLGMAAASTESIAFLDDDDVLLPDGLCQLEERLRKAPADVAVVYGKPKYVRLDAANPMSDALPPGNGVSGWILPQLLRGNIMAIGTMLVRREAMLAQGGHDASLIYIQDWDLWLRLAAHGRFEHVPVEVAEIRLHDTNCSLNTSSATRGFEFVRQKNLFAPYVLEYAARRARDGDLNARRDLAALCVELAQQRWWQGELQDSRRAAWQGLKLAPATVTRELGEAWRAWLPVRRPRWLRRATSEIAESRSV